MKRIYISGLICLLLLCLGCSSTNSPEETAAQYVKGMVVQDYDIMDKYSAIESETIYTAMIQQLAQRYSKSEREVYQMLLDDEDLEKTPENFQEYKEAFVKSMQEKLEKEFGENYSIDATIVSSRDIEPGEMQEILEEATGHYEELGFNISDIVDFPSIEEMKQIQCKATITGTGRDDAPEEDFSLYVVKMDGKWKVLNLGVGI